MREHITKLKTILQCKYLLYLLLVLSLLYSFVCIKKEIYYSKYNLDSTYVIGIINKIEYKSDKTYLYIDDTLISLRDNNNYKIGYKVKVYGKFNKPSSNSNFYLFNYKDYLYSKKIHYIVIPTKIEILNKNINAIYSIKNKIYNYINSRKTNVYLNSFILGNTSLINENVMDSYKINGIIHLFSISGMHMGIFTSVLIYILKKIINIKNNILVYLIITIILLFYIFITNFGVSSIRAFFLFILLFINKQYRLNIKNYYLLLYIFSFSLLINPFNILNNGFLYSYIITFYLMKYTNKNIKNNYIITLLKMSIISILAGLPITINSNFSLNILSPFINLIFVPLVSLIVFPLSLLTAIIPYLDSLFLLFINLMENISLSIARLNIFNITLSHISTLSIVIYYIIITIVISKVSVNNYKYIIIIVILMIFHNNSRYLDLYYTIHYINIGQGDAILITYPFNKSNILIDCGKSDENTGKNILIPYLKANGIKKINTIIITHGDLDHMGEAINLVNNFKVEKVVFNCGGFNDLEQELIKVLDKKKIKYYSCIKELNIDKNKLYFLQTKEYDNENDNSNVIYTELNGFKFMFMGDASRTTEEEILNKYNLPDIDVLKVGHHGSRTSSGKEFINAINPRYSVISVGKNNRYGHPNKEVLNNLEQSKIFRTDQDGSIMFKIKNNKFKIETCSP